MCKKQKRLHNRIDKCMRNELYLYKKAGLIPIACCCGHKKYPKTLIVKIDMFGKDVGLEIFSGLIIPRKRKFYIKDKNNYYFIPEVSKEKK